MSEIDELEAYEWRLTELTDAKGAASRKALRKARRLMAARGVAASATVESVLKRSESRSDRPQPSLPRLRFLERESEA